MELRMDGSLPLSGTYILNTNEELVDLVVTILLEHARGKHIPYHAVVAPDPKMSWVIGNAIRYLNLGDTTVGCHYALLSMSWLLHPFVPRECREWTAKLLPMMLQLYSNPSMFNARIIECEYLRAGIFLFVACALNDASTDVVGRVMPHINIPEEYRIQLLMRNKQVLAALLMIEGYVRLAACMREKWWHVLGLSESAASLVELREAYEALMRKENPSREEVTALIDRRPREHIKYTMVVY